MTNSVKNVHPNQSGEQSSSRGRWSDDRRNRGQQDDRGFSDRWCFPTPGSRHREDFSEEMNRIGEMTGRVSSAEPVDKKDTFRGIVENFSYVEVPNT